MSLQLIIYASFANECDNLLERNKNNSNSEHIIVYPAVQPQQLRGKLLWLCSLDVVSSSSREISA